MITNLPLYVYGTFFVAVLFSILQFYRAGTKSKLFIIGIVFWGIVHSMLAISGFYDHTQTIPPRFILVILPMPAIILATIFSKKMRHWLHTFNLKQITYLHTVRILVEIVLYWLFLEKYIPEILTFEGRNFDILAGITAPIVALVAFRNNTINKPLLLTWNVISLLLLFNVIIYAILSTPTALQQVAFNQPNIAVMKFPFLLLPAVIVPIVLISNLAGFVLLQRKG